MIDLLVVLFLFFLNFIYLFPFFGEANKSNVFSAPLVPLLSYFLTLLTGMEIGKAITVSLLIFILLAPIFFYFFSAKISQRRSVGFLSALIYSLPTELLAKGRMTMALLVGDGGHITALAIVPLSGLFLLNFLRLGNFRSLVLASLVTGLIALSSPFGLLIGLMILLVIAFSEFLQGEMRLKSLRFIFFIGLTVGFVAFWYNPGFVALFLKSQQGLVLKKTFFNLIPLSFVVIPVAAAFGFLLFEKKAELQCLFIALGLVALFSLISFADYIGRFFPSHPYRYLVTLGFSLSFLLGIILVSFSDFLRFRGQFRKIRLSPLGRNLAKKFFWLANLGIIGLKVVFSLNSLWQLPKGQVLGVWSEGITTGQTWEIKRQTGGASAAAGYLVTILTFFLVIFSWLKIKRQKEIING